jgi:2-oxopent-4-enoate/cis-2-oxohex-4-enoate hydratase
MDRATRNDALGDELYAALRERRTVAPLTARVEGLTIDDAYQISTRMVKNRLERDGEKIIGKKIGVTSKAVQEMLDVHQPDFGYLTDAMRFDDGASMPISTALIQPRAEGEIAFVLGKSLKGPGVTDEDVLEATEYVSACFEIVDSRVHDWKVRIQDTIADNASCGLFLLGEEKVDPRSLDFPNLHMRIEKNGAPLSEGYGRAALGSPVHCVTWLANTLGQYGITLDAGDVILSGSLVPLEPVVAGDEMKLTVEGVGSASVKFV